MSTPTTPREIAARPFEGLEDLDLETLARTSSHPVLAATAASLVPRLRRGGPPLAFYEDGPYQL